ncbi:BC85_0335 family putative methyltransferase [Mycoplasma elephantis]|uniref:BC85_0335 family putative methyltransferase n=1 Tax=Mycoplasma elephantis TaxID=114882 RepID=UPI0004849590|nr:hypothetical protein [Mycoplasma elephantis]
MSKTDYYLMISMFVAIGISFVSFIVSLILIKITKDKYKNKIVNQAIRKNAGDVNEDVKNALNINLENNLVDFLINNAFINQYENVLIYGKNAEYFGFVIKNQIKWTKIYHTDIEQSNINKINELGYTYEYKIANENDLFDYVLIMDDRNIESNIKNIYKKLNENGMIAIYVRNLNNFSKSVVATYLKKENLVFEFSHNKKFILIVKNNSVIYNN